MESVERKMSTSAVREQNDGQERTWMKFYVFSWKIKIFIISIKNCFYDVVSFHRDQYGLNEYRGYIILKTSLVLDYISNSLTY